MFDDTIFTFLQTGQTIFANAWAFESFLEDVPGWGGKLFDVMEMVLIVVVGSGCWGGHQGGRNIVHFGGTVPLPESRWMDLWVGFKFPKIYISTI